MAGVGETHFYPLSLLASFSVAQGGRRAEGNRERNCPERIFTDLHFICRPPLPSFFLILYFLYQQLYDCDVMTKASVSKSQAGQCVAALFKDRQGREKERGEEKVKDGDGSRVVGGGLK